VAGTRSAAAPSPSTFTRQPKPRNSHFFVRSVSIPHKSTLLGKGD
jgi:hypothetical protein